jgi:Meiotically up-regulated gene 113
VYAVWDGEFVKVGYSRTHPRTRMAELQAGSSRELILLAYTASLTERQAHGKLHKHRVRGEWFAVCPEILAELNTWDWLDAEALAKVSHAPEP